MNEVITKLSIGKIFIHASAAGSTNSMAVEWLSRTQKESKQFSMHGTVFVARAQTAGRGQMGHTWLMQAGKDAAFSIVLLPIFLSITDQFYLNMAVSLAVYKALNPLIGESLCIKWPNDIYVGDKKLGGILIENTLSGDKISHCIVGIGLNINSDIDTALLPKATSLKNFTNTEYSVLDIIHAVAYNLNIYYAALQQGHYMQLKETYTALLYKYKEIHRFTHNGDTFEATVMGISHPGKLLLQYVDGTVIAYGFKEVVWA